MTTTVYGKLQNASVNEGVANASDIDFLENDGSITKVQDDIMNLRNNSGGGSLTLPATNRRWGQVIRVDNSANAGVSNRDIVFDTATPAEQPFSINHFEGTSGVTDDITNSSTGFVIDTYTNARPNANISPLGGIALRGELVVTKGQATNFRRVTQFTTLLETVRAGVYTELFSLGRRGFTNSQHGVILMTRVGNNVVFGYPAFGGGSAYNELFIVASRHLPNGAQAPAQSYHAQQGDICRFAVEFQRASAISNSDAQPLVATVVMHRFNQLGQHLETIFFNDTGRVQIPDGNVNSTNRAALVNVNFYDYNRLIFTGGNANSTSNHPMVGIESFQYKATTPLDRFFHHSGLDSSTIPPVSDSHRLFGYYSSTPAEKIIVNEQMDFTQNVDISGDTTVDDLEVGGDADVTGDLEVTGTTTLNAVTMNEAVDLPENTTLNGAAISTGTVTIPDPVRLHNGSVAQLASNFADLGEASRPSADGNKLIWIEIISEVGSVTITATRSFLYSDYENATATETALTGNPLNIGRAFLNIPLSNETYNLAKAPNGNLRLHSSVANKSYAAVITQ